MDKQYRILVIDDNPDILDILSEILQQEGYAVYLTDTGEEGLEILQKNDIDLILTDIAMPKLTGYQVFKKARALKPNVHILLMTAFGYDQNHSIVKIRREYDAQIMFKPFNKEKLLKTIKELLETNQQENQ